MAVQSGLKGDKQLTIRITRIYLLLVGVRFSILLEVAGVAGVVEGRNYRALKALAGKRGGLTLMERVRSSFQLVSLNHLWLLTSNGPFYTVSREPSVAYLEIA